ncbi:MAG TPA: HAD family phosphatase [Candidatus Nanopelagicales bacterium]
MEGASSTELTGLIVDWGGVLTGDLSVAVRTWAQSDGIDLDAYFEILRDWLGEPYGVQARRNPIHALERGELTVPAFDQHLATALSERTGHQYSAEGLLSRMFEHFEHAPDMTGLVHRAHESGIRTALLSNSWGNDYPREGWDDMFDVVVISGEVGMRKPEPEIFAHTLALLGRPAHECVFVDDLPHNVDAAVELGIVGVRHTSYQETLLELEALFDRDLS